jgi:hypothetical protein
MIKNLFTKREHRVFSGLKMEQAAQSAAWYWRSKQFGINFTSAYSLTGTQYYSKLGLRQEVSVLCYEVAQGVGVDVTFSAELTDEGAIVGTVGAILVLPVTVAVGAVSYIEYENDAARMISEFWSYMSSVGPRPSDKSASTAEQAPRCPNCHTSLDFDSKFCKFCGTKL